MALTQISTAGVKDDAVTAGKIPANAVGSSEIAANAVGSSELADNAVDTNAIQDDAVTAGKLANDIAINTTGTITAASFSGPATEITVASDTTDTLCFTIFTNTGVGNNGPKVNTSKLSFNSSTGALSATSFVGDGSSLTGISVGIATNAQTVTNGNTLLLDLSKDDHKVTATGTVTISCTGGTEGDSHTVRIVNSGIATVGFSTYFKFPSGATPTIPITSGAISLITFTVHQAGSTGISTQLLSGASVNFS